MIMEGGKLICTIIDVIYNRAYPIAPPSIIIAFKHVVWPTSSKINTCYSFPVPLSSYIMDIAHVYNLFALWIKIMVHSHGLSS
jgi:hypothetical protein